MTWNDLCISGKSGQRDECEIRIWKKKPESSESCQLYYSCSLSFSGMTCLGAHSPHLGRRKNPSEEPLLILNMCGSYFLAEQELSKAVHIGPFTNTQIMRSYDANLLCRFLRMCRASAQQEQTNRNLKSELVKRGLDISADESQLAKPAPPPKSLRQEVFLVKMKESRTRVREINLRNEIDQIKVRILMAKSERDDRKSQIETKLEEIKEIENEIQVRTIKLMDAFHVFGKDKGSLQGWRDRYKENRDFCRSLMRISRRNQLKLLSKFSFVFPIHISNTPTFR